MHFETGHLYHIYNRGNNSQKIFYNRENYLFFLRKLRLYVIPYADILAWVLMPNHFHLMVYVNTIDIDTESITLSETLSINKDPKLRSFNDSIGIMLRTYARAIQKQEKMNGSLFQEHTKASCLTNPNENDFNWFYEEYEFQNNYVLNKQDYPTICFGYIHENPVKSYLCNSIVGWEFSSAPDYFAKRKGKLINKEKAKEYSLY
ncbi:MAG TPA: transposase [Prolixibacteraceae bacterium]|nr:transposase [Prolixibacteraceae bacterium]